MTEPGLKVSASNLSRASAGRARNPNTLSRLQALDKNGDGQLDLDEVCDAIDEIVRKEKTERTLKWLLAALAVFSLLTIAATVGLTYAVVALSKDTLVDSGVLQSKDTGEALRTGSFLQSQNASTLLDSVTASGDPAAALARISSIKVPSLKDGEAYTVHKVDAVTMLTNGSAVVYTATGLQVLMPAGAVPVDTAAPTVDAPALAGRRRLLQGTPITVDVYQGPYNASYAYHRYQISLTESDTVGDLIDKIAASPGAPPKDLIQLYDYSPAVSAEGRKELKESTRLGSSSIKWLPDGGDHVLEMGTRKVEV